MAATARGDAAALNTLGVILRARGHAHEAIDWYRQAASLAPGDAAVQANLGNALLAEAEILAALQAYGRALASDPGHEAARVGRLRAIRAALERACLAINGNDANSARPLLEAVLEFDPADMDALYLLTHAALRSHDPATATRAAEQLVVLSPGAARSWATLARVRVEQGCAIDAEAASWRAITLDPLDVQHAVTLATRFLDQGRVREALDLAATARGSAPADARPPVLQALIHQKAGNLPAARRLLLEADHVFPGEALDARLATRLSVMGQLGDLVERDRARASLRRLLDGLPAAPGPLPVDTLASGLRFAFLMPFYGFADGSRSRVLRALAASVVGAGRRPDAPRPAASENSGSRLRVGYLSPNFGEHPTGHLTAPIFEAHDRERIELFAYSSENRRADPGEYPARLRRAVEHWRDAEGLDDAALARRIAADRLHVLVDLGGYLAGGRPGVLACRPAPVQIHWIMHLGGMPAPFVDYTIVDRTMVPEPHELHGPLLRLPHAFQPGYRQPVAAAPGERAAHGLPPTGAVLCAFNNPLKIDTIVFAAWMRIMALVPDATLWLAAGGGGAWLAQLDEAARRHGIDPCRLVYAPRLADRSMHLSRQLLAALYLDTFTFGGATSAMDALLVGLPVLTRLGDQAYGRIGASFLRVLGLDELVARDTDEYVARAAALLASPDRLADLQRRLRQGVDHGPLFDAALFARHMEALYATAWSRHASGLAPHSVDLLDNGAVVEV